MSMDFLRIASDIEEELVMIGECEMHDHLLSQQETGFLISIKGKLKKDHSLSKREQVALCNIWLRVVRMVERGNW